MNFAVKQLVFILQILILSPSAFAEFTGGLTELELAEPTEIDGIPCMDEALMYADGRLEGCRLSQDVRSFRKHKWIEIDRDGNVVNVIFEEDEGK